MPHALAAHAGEPILAKSLGLLWATRYILFPIERLLAFIEFLVRRLLGKSQPTLAEEAERVEQEIAGLKAELEEIESRWWFRLFTGPKRI